MSVENAHWQATRIQFQAIYIWCNNSWMILCDRSGFPRLIETYIVCGINCVPKPNYSESEWVATLCEWVCARDTHRMHIRTTDGICDLFCRKQYRWNFSYGWLMADGVFGCGQLTGDYGLILCVRVWHLPWLISDFRCTEYRDNNPNKYR